MTHATSLGRAPLPAELPRLHVRPPHGPAGDLTIYRLDVWATVLREPRTGPLWCFGSSPAAAMATLRGEIEEYAAGVEEGQQLESASALSAWIDTELSHFTLIHIAISGATRRAVVAGARSLLVSALENEAQVRELEIDLSSRVRCVRGTLESLP